MTRRAWIGGATGFAVAAAGTTPVIDSHIHLFDPARPQGVPWPDKSNTVLYRPALPERYRQIAEPLGIKGAIVVEASPWLEDNQWVLDQAAHHPIIVGVIGNLDPAQADFRKQLERFHQNPLFRGIRYGNLWGRDLSSALSQPDFVAGMQALADAGLTLDTANPNAALLTAVLRLSDRVPKLRIVLDHLPQMEPPAGAATLRELAHRPQVYVKVSEVLRRVDGRVPADLNFYRARIDEIYSHFGPDRLLFGSDWPNSDQWAPYTEVFRVVHEYFTAKGPAVAEQYFRQNSVAAYRWGGR